MALIIACPRGITLPYSSLFNLGLRENSSRAVKSRPSEYFWKKAISDVLPEFRPKSDLNDGSSDAWLDFQEPALSESEGESQPRDDKPRVQPKKKRFHTIRRITFKAFTPKSDGTSHHNNIVTSTEIVSRQERLSDFGQHGSGPPKAHKRISVFNSWKFKSNGVKTQVHKAVAVLKARISASSPADQQPKTWDEYHRFYANEQIDILNPPLPPMEPAQEGDTPTAFQSRFYMAPKPANEHARQLVVNRLGVMGGNGYDVTDEGEARFKARTEMCDELIEKGKAPTSLEESWQHRDSIGSEESGMGIDEARAMLEGVRTRQLPPDTLEQHPVFKKIVKQCREIFGTEISMLSVFDDDRQVFLAESGVGGKRDISRDIGFCAHTILSGRKGFTILDTHKDWRFENNPLTKNFGSRFYAGVPLLAPNLDGSQESEDNACPIGTLCVVDTAPRESFSVEDRRKLVYMSEYARREIEKWFAKKMERKMQQLTAGEENWNQELKRVVSSSSDGDDTLECEVLSDTPASPDRIAAPSKRSSFRRLASISSISTTPTSPSSTTHMALKAPTRSGPTLFEDVNAAVKPKMRKVFDLATKLIAETLDLSLVYLTAVVPHGDSDELGRTMILSGFNIPLPVPVFDAGLHLRALRAPEGGFLYQNPSVAESEEVSFQPKGSGNTPYASALLLAVGTEAQPNSGGFVLAGYTQDPKRVFGAEDVNFMKQFALQLSKYTSRLQLR